MNNTARRYAVIRPLDRTPRVFALTRLAPRIVANDRVFAPDLSMRWSIDAGSGRLEARWREQGTAEVEPSRGRRSMLLRIVAPLLRRAA